MRSTNSTSLKYDKDVFIKIKREFFDLCYFWQFEVTIISHSGNLPSMREEQKEFWEGGYFWISLFDDSQSFLSH